MALGRRDDAAQLWSQVLTLAPQHPQALLHSGQFVLQRGDARGALEYFAKAQSASPKDPVAALNIAFAHRSLGDTKAEFEALERALAADPYFFPALLSKAALLVRLGRRRAAARIYKDAMTIAPPDSELAPELQRAMERGREIVRENAQSLDAFLSSRMGSIRERHAGANLARFEECQAIAAGTKKIYRPQPTMLDYPGLPTIQYYDNADFPWLKGIEAARDKIHEELLALLAEEKKEGFGPYVRHETGAPVNQWEELNFSPRWSAYFLWQDGKRLDDHCRRCPRTTQAVEAAPLIQIPGFAPAVFFSTLDPHTRIPAHTGVTNARLIVHLPLILPGKCYFRVGNDTREWQDGKAWIFDDTMEHEARNDSDKLRVILIFDIWNPYLSAAERDLVSELLLSTREYYRDA
ncbi:MAG: aspartyl/asparaginyl beta-hydroxylase domain-containing protein [Proteobacteria bacterium]|nr:aspartyl/asparaginyl beta-hydroxylase domain-containing protein [Pseudomonadota bacterium]